MSMTHYGDPCLHCGIGHDDVPVGPCKGETNKAVVIGARYITRRWDCCEHWRVLWSDGRIESVWWHVDEIPNLWLSRLRMLSEEAFAALTPQGGKGGGK